MGQISVEWPMDVRKNISKVSNNQVILHHFQIVLIHNGLETVFVMIRLTLRTVIMMVETVVATMSTLIFVLIVNAMSMRHVSLVLIL